jgi:hypothetical protein
MSMYAQIYIESDVDLVSDQLERSDSLNIPSIIQSQYD